MEWILDVAKYISEVAIITGAIAKILDIKLNEIHKRDRMTLRYQIVSFSSSLRKGDKKTRDEFLSIFEQIDEYNNICEKLHIENHLFEEEVKYIDRCYKSLDILQTGLEKV